MNNSRFYTRLSSKSIYNTEQSHKELSDFIRRLQKSVFLLWSIYDKCKGCSINSLVGYVNWGILIVPFDLEVGDLPIILVGVDIADSFVFEEMRGIVDEDGIFFEDSDIAQLA